MRAEQMTVEQKVGQILMIGYQTMDIPAEMETWIRKRHIGNVILFSRNIDTPEKTFERMRVLQSWAREAKQPYPLLIGTDQENGVVTRLQRGATRFPGAMALGATGNPKHAKRIYQATGEELRSAGISINFAPTIDVNLNPLNPVIGVRSFGEDPECVSRFGEAAVQGLLASNVIPAVKHFPGHGDTSTDSHEAIPVLRHDLKRLTDAELVPFRRCIEAGVPMVMVGHISLPMIDESGSAASTSTEMVTEILRNSLRFEGVAITDCMEMAAIANSIGVPEAAVLAIQAGIDMVLISHTQDVQKKTHARLLEAIHRKEISLNRVNEAVARVVQLKKRFLSWESCLAEKGPSFDRDSHEKMAEETLSQAVTLVKNENQLLPIAKSIRQLGVVLPGVTTLTLAEDDQSLSEDLLAPLQKYCAVNGQILSSLDPLQSEVERIVTEVAKTEIVIVFTYNAHIYKGQALLVQRLKQSGKKVVAVALRNPYDLMEFPEVDTYLAVYDHGKKAIERIADVLFGKCQAVGQLPVSIRYNRHSKTE
ncbi:glycoside hydrolase family 3 N-terminal domain-containing protein [Brevibacillus sp. NRS-1366]|uniref:glycoside hydrolase family 3 protein n=1 Tax=Brevibacillus sp. NRS-1366 TaxID=3233899 RepID=UPI003D21F30E